MNSRLFLSFAGVAVLAAIVPSSSRAAAVVRSVGGDATGASINSTRVQFQMDLGGGTVAGPNGSFGGLRREINWDGVPAAFSAPNNLPANFFNVNSPRGVVFFTPGTGFQVSGSTTDSVPVEFDNINPTYSSTFGVFSPQRLFTAISSNIIDVSFFLPGTTTPATVGGFGAIFTDVDLANTTSLQFFDALNFSLGTFFVPTGTVASQSLSFLGTSFNAGERVGRVRITSGNSALGLTVNDGGATDVVVLDDFIYSEPVPEPGTICFLALALSGFCAASRVRASRGKA